MINGFLLLFFYYLLRTYKKAMFWNFQDIAVFYDLPVLGRFIVQD